MAETQKSKNKYRATFLLDTRDYQEPVETLIERLKEVIKGVGGVIAEVKNRGMHDFMRVRKKKFSSGIYVEVAFDGPSTAPEGIRQKLSLDRHFNRQMIELVG